ncbi:hypothetical protein GKE82_07835 [Conexibacter sp. W3-3-2]|uniref:hypothetical protein n=1 Tax=Conexibacter sp. W3-3-2 TaxID=2675227 RepID=UPI0012B85092|nr:hypothetical protein [Conexibacter sp. W3-3-2]MTD44213.1 hypothetical protein [Conexibacter sp. W3-3-2]
MLAARDRPVRTGLLAYGTLQLAIGLWQAVDPGSFYTALGPFDGRNDHYVRDVASWTLALGVLCLLAASRPAWRLPVLALAALQSALHTLNHLLDAGDADTHWVGIADAVSLALLTVLLLALVRKETTP